MFTAFCALWLVIGGYFTFRVPYEKKEVPSLSMIGLSFVPFLLIWALGEKVHVLTATGLLLWEIMLSGMIMAVLVLILSLFRRKPKPEDTVSA